MADKSRNIHDLITAREVKRGQRGIGLFAIEAEMVLTPGESRAYLNRNAGIAGLAGQGEHGLAEVMTVFIFNLNTGVVERCPLTLTLSLIHI